MKVLSLAFEKGLQDKYIAEEMCVSERMVRCVIIGASYKML
jgi:DNA-binding NarL/FixJ family response regulator